MPTIQWFSSLRSPCLAKKRQGREGDSRARWIHPPSFPRKRESNASAWIPGLRFTAPGMTGQRGAGIRSLSGHSHARGIDPPSFPRKRESNTSAWIPGLRFTPPGMTGRGGCFFFPLCQLCGHGWRPAGFGPLPRGRVPFCLQQQKGTKKCRPDHPADSCASRPGRGLADASIRAANAGHPWPAPAGLIRPGLRCSGDEMVSSLP